MLYEYNYTLAYCSKPTALLLIRPSKTKMLNKTMQIHLVNNFARFQLKVFVIS